MSHMRCRVEKLKAPRSIIRISFARQTLKGPKSSYISSYLSMGLSWWACAILTSRKASQKNLMKAKTKIVSRSKKATQSRKRGKTKRRKTTTIKKQTQTRRRKKWAQTTLLLRRKGRWTLVT